jgi:hypothetical protein
MLEISASGGFYYKEITDVFCRAILPYNAENNP